MHDGQPGEDITDRRSIPISLSCLLILHSRYVDLNITHYMPATFQQWPICGWMPSTPDRDFPSNTAQAMLSVIQQLFVYAFVRQATPTRSPASPTFTASIAGNLRVCGTPWHWRFLCVTHTVQYRQDSLYGSVAGILYGIPGDSFESKPQPYYRSAKAYRNCRKPYGHSASAATGLISA